MNHRNGCALRFDLHTHPLEGSCITKLSQITRHSIERIVTVMKKRRLDGIAITEHNDFSLGYEAAKYADDFGVIILPGEEIDWGDHHILRISVFGKDYYILAHPRIPFESTNQVKLDAVEFGSKHGKYPLAYQIAEERNIPLVQNSDAHLLCDLGLYASFIDLEAYLRGEFRLIDARESTRYHHCSIDSLYSDIYASS
jgi:hypothetical protein